ncbi:MAG TPA: hypothetical protein DEO94_03250 [Cyanobacteria bacterium UBA11991]|nr:hypothetical protein [Cyanobacteriota bacterium]MDY6359246.1 hypothetical protein [Cyanobacteriota bacterium]MDY6364559.1 hypothetical protein [Cyanobacteriota bacterium]MDY6383496.1 hypothetical protein [Cyanobacteriota bacterium]HCB11159.1 hypothetical protein [Cyanobacteria bacterium UBA11991]
MGCLRNVTRAIFLTIVIVGLVTFCNRSQIRESVKNVIHPTHDVILERAQKVGDFSKINSEFEIEKAAGLMGYNAVVAEHKASGQKMVIVDTAKKRILTPADIKAPNAEERIKNAISKFKYQSAAIEEFKVTEKGSMRTYGKNVPYVRFTARIKKLPVGEISGIISVVEDKSGDDRILVSANYGGKYSQLISNEFFKAVK